MMARGLRKVEACKASSRGGIGSSKVIVVCLRPQAWENMFFSLQDFRLNMFCWLFAIELVISRVPEQSSLLLPFDPNGW